MDIFRYFSDLHGYLPDFVRDTDKNEICILAGDMTEFSKAGTELLKHFRCLCIRFKEVIFVPGNHEYYGTHIGTLELKIRKGMADVDNFTILQGGEYVTRGDTRIIGATMWSDTSSVEYDAQTMMNDYKYIRIGPDRERWKYRLKPMHTTKIHYADVKAINEALKDYEGDSIVITHHAPSIHSLDRRYEGSVLNPAYATDIELDKWPNYWIHGHIHRACSYIHNGCNVRCNPGGYPTEYTDFEPINNRFIL